MLPDLFSNTLMMKDSKQYKLQFTSDETKVQRDWPRLHYWEEPKLGRKCTSSDWCSNALSTNHMYPSTFVLSSEPPIVLGRPKRKLSSLYSQQHFLGLRSLTQLPLLSFCPRTSAFSPPFHTLFVPHYSVGV